jgi:hypothetical protein
MIVKKSKSSYIGEMLPSLPGRVWGWLPVQSVFIAIGVLLIAIACSGSRMNATWSQPLFWVGYLAIILLPIIRLTMRGVSRQERISTILFVGVAFYCIKILYSPLIFNFNDELQHWRSTFDTIQSHSLFQYNATLPVSSYFPGLESIANAFISISSVGIFDGGVVIVGMARLLTMLSLFLLFERTSQSGYLAGIACLVYLADPNFLLGDSQYTYEGLAISLTITGVYCVLRRVQMDESRRRLSLIIAAIIFFSSVIVTHHVTSYILAILISIWGITSISVNRFPEWKLGPTLFAMLIVSGCAAWLALVGPIVIPYISVPLRNGFTQAMQVVLGEQAPRTFFQGGQQVPIWLQLPSYFSVIFLVVLLPFGLFAILRKGTTNSLSLAFAVMSLGYYLSQVLRLAPLGIGLTNRLAGAGFLSLSYVVGAGAVEFLNRRHLKGQWHILLIIYLFIVNFGSATAVISARALPGSYDNNIFSRRINTEGLVAADWASNILGPNHRFGADYINMLLFGSYGRQRLVTDLSDNIFIEESIFATREFGEQEKDILRKGDVDFLILDTRIENRQVVGPALPNSSAYQTNLDGLETIDRVFDSGHIIIFRLGFVRQPQINPNANHSP